MSPTLPAAELTEWSPQNKTPHVPEEVAGLEGLYADPPADRVVGPSDKIYGPDTSCVCLRVHHVPRRWAIRMVEWRLFDPIILLTILCNCVTMACVRRK